MSCRNFSQEIKRDYDIEDVELIRGTVTPDCTLAKEGARKLRNLINRGEDTYVNALGAMTGIIIIYYFFIYLLPKRKTR